VETAELLAKLDLIEEQARQAFDELTQSRAKERQLMIVALVKQIRWAVTDTPEKLADPEATVRLPS
jgi:uncharacterized protein YqfA (UPF0365 family)